MLTFHSLAHTLQTYEAEERLLITRPALETIAPLAHEEEEEEKSSSLYCGIQSLLQ